jgi:hypothetical protein
VIVLDESIHGYELVAQITGWYAGTVISINRLRPATVVKDDGIVTLLQAANDPTFVTINVKDFWRQCRADKRYCVICLLLEQQRALEISPMLRTTLALPEFRTKAARMGRVILVRPSRIEYYGTDRQICHLPWSPD